MDSRPEWHKNRRAASGEPSLDYQVNQERCCKEIGFCYVRLLVRKRIRLRRREWMNRRAGKVSSHPVVTSQARPPSHDRTEKYARRDGKEC